MARWTDEHLALLEQGLRDKIKTCAIAKSVNRSSHAVRVKLRSLGRRVGSDEVTVSPDKETFRRFIPGPATNAKAKILPHSHPAVTESRTMYTWARRVAGTGEVTLKSGQHNQKIGRNVRKGWLRGAPIFTLTLEERATCPTSCTLWRSCYGNRMHWARRFAAGPELETELAKELAELDAKHRATGFLVRLHILGDFYSPEYVRLWASWLANFPALNVFGFTAHSRDSEIGGAITDVFQRFDRRFALRFSGQTGPMTARTLSAMPATPRVDDAVVCPEQWGVAHGDASHSCGSCGLCWNSKVPIAFAEH